MDEETGLYYHGARYYEPKFSRWMSADPAGFALINPNRDDYSIIEATNWYAYVSNNPVNYVDPTGMNIGEDLDTGLPKTSKSSNSSSGSSSLRPTSSVPYYVYNSGGSSGSSSDSSSSSSSSSSSNSSSNSFFGGGGGNNWLKDSRELNERENVYLNNSSSTTTSGSNHKRSLPLGILGKIWASPITLMGSLGGLLLVGLDRVINGKGRITVSNNAINFITSFELGSAITLGNSVIYAGGEGFGPEYMGLRYDGPTEINVGMHEEAHTYQYQFFGIFFPFVYLPSGGMWKPSWLEHAADDYSETGGKASWLLGKRRNK